MAKLLLLAIVVLVFFVVTSYSKLPATSQEIFSFTEQLFANADKRLSKKVTFNIKSKPVMKVKEADLNSVETVQTMRDLFKFYKLDSATGEVVTAEQQDKQNKFLDAVIKTTVMKMLMTFFKKKNVAGIYNVSETVAKANFKKLLSVLWFTNYARMKGGPKGSSGFEHVFCKEVIHKNNDKELSGYHNWIYSHDQEMATNSKLAFQKLIKQLSLYNTFTIVKFQVSYDKMQKVTSMFLGTTPEFDMTLYTLCVVMDKETCEVSLGGQKFTIKTYAFARGADKLVASSYPAI